MPRISVVIPTWNRQDGLVKAIRSVANQTISDMEILICDDGSTDSTNTIIHGIQKSNNSIKWLPGKHYGGPANARNRGIASSQSEWVAFLDSDDTWIDIKLEDQIEYANKFHYDMVATNAYRITSSTKELYFPLTNQDGEIFFKELLLDNKIICSSVLIKKSALEWVGGFPEGDEFIAIEDYLTWLKVSTKYRIGYMSEAMVEYSDLPAQTIRSRWIDYPAQKRSVFKYMLEWMSSNFIYSPKYINLFIQLMFSHFKRVNI